MLQFREMTRSELCSLELVAEVSIGQRAGRTTVHGVVRVRLDLATKTNSTKKDLIQSYVFG